MHWKIIMVVYYLLELIITKQRRNTNAWSRLCRNKYSITWTSAISFSLKDQKSRWVDNSVFPCYTVLQLIGGLVNAFTKLDKMPKDRSVFYLAFLYNREFQEEMIWKRQMISRKAAFSQSFSASPSRCFWRCSAASPPPCWRDSASAIYSTHTFCTLTHKITSASQLRSNCHPNHKTGPPSVPNYVS